MNNNSIIKNTRQLWKIVVMLIGLLTAGVLFLFSIIDIDNLSNNQFFVWMLSGIAIGGVSFIYACIAIKCPYCGNKWLWRAVSTADSNKWLAWLFSRSTCPACGEPGGTHIEKTEYNAKK